MIATMPRHQRPLVEPSAWERFKPEPYQMPLVYGLSFILACEAIVLGSIIYQRFM